MKQEIKMVTALILIVLISSIILFYVNYITKDIILEHKKNSEKSGYNTIFPDADNIIENEDYSEIYKNYNLIGFASIGKAQGYSSEIKLLVGFNSDYSIKSIIVLEQLETPGLGTLITKKEFLEQFEEVKMNNLQVKNEGGSIDTVSGATISSNAFIVAVKDAYSKLPLTYK